MGQCLPYLHRVMPGNTGSQSPIPAQRSKAGAALALTLINRADRLHIVHDIFCFALPEKDLVTLFVVYRNLFALELLDLFRYLLVIR